MGIIRNILAFIGLIALIGGIIAFVMFGRFMGNVQDFREDIQVLKQLDPKAEGVYREMWEKLKNSRNSADATVVVYPVTEGATPEEVEEAMRFAANENNIKNVGELPLSDQVALETGEEQRFLKIYQFCNPQTAMKMVDYSEAFSAYLPCRIALVEGKEGGYKLYSLNMDMMIYGGETLPEDLHEEALRVQSTIIDIMERGASGEVF